MEALNVVKSRTEALSFRFCSMELSDSLSRWPCVVTDKLILKFKWSDFLPYPPTSMFFKKVKLQETNIKDYQAQDLTLEM